eukprot:2705671-Pleurochrysis_carterae.AAC.2
MRAARSAALRVDARLQPQRVSMPPCTSQIASSASSCTSPCAASTRVWPKYTCTPHTRAQGMHGQVNLEKKPRGTVPTQTPISR